MRTTINLPDSLGEEAKRRAVEEGRTFTSLVEEGLRTVLAAPASSPEALPELPTYGDPNGRLLIDITNRDALWEVLEADEGR